MQRNPFDSKFEVLSATLSNTANDPKYISYPATYNSTNTLIVGAMYKVGSNWANFVQNNAARFDSAVTPSGIQIIPRSSEALGATVRIAIIQT